VRQFIGVFLLSIGSLFLFLGFVFSHELLVHKLEQGVMSAFWALLLLYNWTIGSNRGHVVHLLSICGFLAAGLLFFLNDVFHPDVLALYAIGGAIAILLIYPTLRYRKQLYENYYRAKGIQ
jgi:membrane-bound ClpP family serine protease